MMETQKETIRRRFREYGEPIATSPHLREALTDEQATELMDWGMATLQQFVEETAVLPDEEAHPTLEVKATAVSLIMELVNQLVEEPGRQPNEDIVNDRAVRLGKNLYWLTGNRNRKAYRQKYAEYDAIRETADAETLFKHLMAIIYAYNDEEE